MRSETKTVSGSGMTLLPAKRGTCELCAGKHGTDEPHDAMSLFYTMRFQMTHGRSPTWADAIAHCPDQTKVHWKGALLLRDVWSEPIGDPISEPGGVAD